MDRTWFIQQVNSLIVEFENGAKGRENVTLKDFLNAVVAYAEDIQGYYDNMNIHIDANIPSWRVFADILKGATMYE